MIKIERTCNRVRNRYINKPTLSILRQNVDVISDIQHKTTQES